KFDRVIVRKYPRRQNASVVEDKQVAFAQEHFQIAKLSMFDCFCVAMQHHHARIVSAWCRSFSNQLFRQRVIVVAQLRTHCGIINSESFRESKSFADSRKTSQYAADAISAGARNRSPNSRAHP